MERDALPEGVPVTLKGPAFSGGFLVLLPGIPRVGEHLTFALARRRGQGRYRITSVEWIYKGAPGEVVVQLEPV
jgi:hypothetical protein